MFLFYGIIVNNYQTNDEQTDLKADVKKEFQSNHLTQSRHLDVLKNRWSCNIKNSFCRENVKTIFQNSIKLNQCFNSEHCCFSSIISPFSKNEVKYCLETPRFYIIGDIDVVSNNDTIDDFFKKIISLITENNFAKLADLNDHFSLVIYDKIKKHYLLIRDQLGFCNLFYYQYNGHLYVSNNLELLSLVPQYKKSVDSTYLHDLLRSKYKNVLIHRSSFKNIYTIPAAHVGEVKNDFSVKAYWKLSQNTLDIKIKPKQNYQQLESAYVEKFKKVLLKPYENYKDRTIALTLSGGLDSSLLTGLLTKNGFKIKAFSYYLPSFPLTDESVYINQTVEKFNIKHEYVNVENHLPYCDDKYYKSYELATLDSYNPFMQSIYQRISGQGYQVLSSGLFGDCLFMGIDGLLVELLKQNQLFYFIKNTSIKELKQHLFYKGNRVKFYRHVLNKCMPEYMRKRDIKNLIKLFSININDENDTLLLYKLMDNLAIEYGHRRALSHTIYINNLAMSLNYFRSVMYLDYGFKTILPYTNKQVIEFFYNLPAFMIDRYPYQDRYIQRQALRSIGLHHVADRKDKTTFYSACQKGMQDNKQRMIDVLQQSKLKEDNYIKKPLDKLTIKEIINYYKIELWYRQFR